MFHPLNIESTGSNSFARDVEMLQRGRRSTVLPRVCHCPSACLIRLANIQQLRHLACLGAQTPRGGARDSASHRRCPIVCRIDRDGSPGPVNR